MASTSERAEMSQRVQGNQDLSNAKRGHATSGLRPLRGIAATEAALTLPVVFLFVFSMLQICHSIYLRQKLTSACYIGMQQIAQADASDESVVSTVNALLTSRGIANASVTIPPPSLLGIATLPQTYTLRVTAPVSTNLPSPRLIPMSGTIVVEQTIYK